MASQEKREENQLLRESISSPWDEFRNHPDQVAHLRWELLRNFYQDVVRVNGILLIELSEKPQFDRRFRKKLLRTVLRGGGPGYDGEITRLLYNYLTSAATLADHCRRVMRAYESTEFHKDYENQVKTFTELPESAFLKDLRNYFAHHKIPSLGLSIGDVEHDAGDFRHEALIYTSDLDDSHKWSSRSKEYIEDHFPHVYIAGLIKVHLEKMSELYSWIFSNFMNLHEAEYNDSLRIKEDIAKGTFHSIVDNKMGH